MEKKTKNMKATSESLKAQIAALIKLYRARKSALEKLSKSILEDDDKKQSKSINK